MFSVAKSEDDSSRDSKYRNCFEVNTRGRGYLFCADTPEELEDWVDTFKKIINSDAADNLVSRRNAAVAVCHVHSFSHSLTHSYSLSLSLCRAMTKWGT